MTLSSLLAFKIKATLSVTKGTVNENWNKDLTAQKVAQEETEQKLLTELCNQKKKKTKEDSRWQWCRTGTEKWNWEDKTGEKLSNPNGVASLWPAARKLHIHAPEKAGGTREVDIPLHADMCQMTDNYRPFGAQLSFSLRERQQLGPSQIWKLGWKIFIVKQFQSSCWRGTLYAAALPRCFQIHSHTLVCPIQTDVNSAHWEWWWRGGQLLTPTDLSSPTRENQCTFDWYSHGKRRFPKTARTVISSVLSCGHSWRKKNQSTFFLHQSSRQDRKSVV